MKDKENKLYELSYVKDSESFSESLSFSHSTDKLQNSVPQSSWFINSDPNNKRLKLSSKDDVYPKYLIYEVNLII